MLIDKRTRVRSFPIFYFGKLDSGCAERLINMANSVAPDSWEQQADSADTTADNTFIEGKFSTLNVNAAEFVPSFCINSLPQSNPTSNTTTTNPSEPVNPDNTVATPEAATSSADTPVDESNSISDSDVATSTFVPPETHHGL